MSFDQIGHAVHSGVLTVLVKRKLGHEELDCLEYRSTLSRTNETNDLSPNYKLLYLVISRPANQHVPQLDAITLSPVCVATRPPGH